MKKIYTLLLFIAVASSVATAQNKDTKKADELYDRLAYTDAAKAYEKLLSKGKSSRYVFERLGNSYFFINNTGKAETYYKRVVKGRNVEAETVYNYAQSLKANGKFSDYNTWMQKFSEMKPNDSRAKEFLKNPNYVPTLTDKTPEFSVKNMADLNSKYADFGGIIYGKDFYFASGRNTTRKNYDWNKEPFLEIYKASNVGGTIKNATLLNGDVNTKFHEGNVVLSADGKKMFFDRNDYYEGDLDKGENGINQINIYTAENIDGVWKDIQSVSFNNDNYSVGHPALTRDGNTLYFSSDMPGGQGGSDLYRVSINKDGTFGTPKNLGPGINTEGKETFPYIDTNGTLYFSSDGHLGLGGLDVFMAEAEGDSFGEVINLGAGLNSTADDFAFKFDPVLKEGYVSSNRTGGKGGDDIYSVKKLIAPCTVNMVVEIINEYTREPLTGARVDLYDTMENKLSTKITDENGNVSFATECDKAHVVQATMKDFESGANEVEKATEGETKTTIGLRPIEAMIVDDKVILEPIYFDLDKHNIKPQAAFELDKLVGLMKKYSNMVIAVESHTDNRDTDAYNLKLSEKRAQSTVQYIISKGIDSSRISGKGFGESRPVISCATKCTEAQHQKNRRSEFNIISR
ncbi:OmpA family protein [Cochleicola gelatinilyticus]|uniref:Cell envelope biogenesis protein OmpA n=1 Tax=Cochleicola gelatinilyticus TaxID=1763537 RepID=A0A167IWS4_9FLAO|nr:OmpA family protein [Cochleicola gelatinilyticus]OAB80091.1 cell envelope biogenesis protein OmpA [Cochleicola gelatinilyticus]